MQESQNYGCIARNCSRRQAKSSSVQSWGEPAVNKLNYYPWDIEILLCYLRGQSYPAAIKHNNLLHLFA